MMFETGIAKGDGSGLVLTPHNGAVATTAAINALRANAYPVDFKRPGPKRVPHYIPDNGQADLAAQVHPDGGM